MKERSVKETHSKWAPRVVLSTCVRVLVMVLAACGGTAESSGSVASTVGAAFPALGGTVPGSAPVHGTANTISPACATATALPSPTPR